MPDHKMRLAEAVIAVYAAVYPFAALAQTTSAQTATTGATTNSGPMSASGLANTYSASIGSTDDAKNVISGMRAGKDVTLGDQTISGTGSTMGYGNINIALSLAKAEAGTQAKTADFLSALDKVMDLRASGMGWGQIANDLGFNLGQVMGNSKSSSTTAKAGNATRSGTAGSARADAGKANGQGHGAGGMGGGQGAGNGGGNAGGGNGGGGGGGGKK